MDWDDSVRLPLYPWAEVHYQGHLICEARWERDRWLLLAPPQRFLDELPYVVEVKEMLHGRRFSAQVELEFDSVYVREVDEPSGRVIVPEEERTPWSEGEG